MNVVSTVSVKHTEPVPPPSPGPAVVGLAEAGRHSTRRHGDLDYLDPYGSIVSMFSADKGTTSAETLTPGNYLAVDLSNTDPIRPT